MAAASLPVLMVMASVQETTPEAAWLSAVFAADQWATIAAILGFGAHHLQNRDSPLLRYLTGAVFPCYLAHQTILVFAVWLIRPLNLPALVEAGSLIVVTVGGCLALYEGVRRVSLLRPLWGLKPLPKRAAARQAGCCGPAPLILAATTARPARGAGHGRRGGVTLHYGATVSCSAPTFVMLSSLRQRAYRSTQSC